METVNELLVGLIRAAVIDWSCKTGWTMDDLGICSALAYTPARMNFALAN